MVRDMDFAQQLRAELKEQGITVYRLARLLDPGNPWRAERNLYFWLSGTKNPSETSREGVARALGKPPDFFAVRGRDVSKEARARKSLRHVKALVSLLDLNRDGERIA